MTRESAPVGLFDSGVGGLTVVRALRARYPCQAVRYVADQAHVPYGDRDPDEVRGFALSITRALVQSGCAAVVMACNISSATALQAARDEQPDIPILGVIAPAVQTAAQHWRESPGPIGILATSGTVKTGVYERALHQAVPEAAVVPVACPAFVPIIEEGHCDGPEIRHWCRQYLLPLAQAGCTVVILGCTHYPLVLPALESVAADLFSSPPVFVDPAEAVIEELSHQFPLTSTGPCQPMELQTTGSPDVFDDQVRRLWPAADFQVLPAEWCGNRLTLARPRTVGQNCLAEASARAAQDDTGTGAASRRCRAPGRHREPAEADEAPR